MRIERYIVILLVVVSGVLPVSAKPKPQQPAAELSVEEQQQFTYYWYAAKQSILEERYPDAFVQLQFCSQLNPHDGKTLDLLGTMYDALGQKERAFRTYEQAFNASPRDQWLHYSKALLEQKTAEGNRRALRVLETAHQLDPSNEDILERLEQIYIGLGEWKKALQTQDKTDRIKGADGYSAFNRMRIYVLQNKSKKAIAVIDQWLENDPTNVQFLLYRIDILERSKAKYSELCASYERILALMPGNLMVLNNYAYLVATHGGDLNQAEQMSQVTIREEPDNPVYLDTYAWILHLKGQDDLARFYLNKALGLATGETKAEIERHLNMIK